MAIAIKGVARARKKSEETGATTVHDIMDSIFYSMPDGTILTKSFFTKSKRK